MLQHQWRPAELVGGNAHPCRRQELPNGKRREERADDAGGTLELLLDEEGHDRLREGRGELVNQHDGVDTAECFGFGWHGRHGGGVLIVAAFVGDARYSP